MTKKNSDHYHGLGHLYIYIGISVFCFLKFTQQLIPNTWAMRSSANNRPSAVSVCLERLHRGPQPKNFWSTSSSHDTPRRQPTWQSWSIATAAGSLRATGRNPAPMTQICELSKDAAIYQILSTGNHLGDTDPIRCRILAKISGINGLITC